jgi:predicted nucleic acid-binding Zn ribbon protein
MIRCEESPHAGRCGRSACNRGVEGRQKTVIARHLGNSLHNWAKPFRVKHQELTPTPACVLEFFDLARLEKFKRCWACGERLEGSHKFARRRQRKVFQ